MLLCLGITVLLFTMLSLAFGYVCG